MKNMNLSILAGMATAMNILPSFGPTEQYIKSETSGTYTKKGPGRRAICGEPRDPFVPYQTDMVNDVKITKKFKGFRKIRAKHAVHGHTVWVVNPNLGV